MNKSNKYHQNFAKKHKDINVALVLGGGGVRGAAQIGVLKVLEENNIPLDLIIGSSVGTFIAAGYSYYRSWKILRDKLYSININDLIDISKKNYIKMLYSRTGLCNGWKFSRMLVHQLPDADIRSLSIPLILMATELENFEPYEIISGNIVEAVRACTAIPPFYPPVAFDNKILIDGAIGSPLPADVAKKYNAKVIIAVDISMHQSTFDNSNMMKIAYRSLDIAYYHLCRYQGQYADILIHPKLTAPTLGAVDYDMLFEEGRKEALKMLPEIKKRIAVL